jgi:hypothetical protein
MEPKLQGIYFSSRHLGPAPSDGKLTDIPSFSQDIGDGSLTGQVGTALYVAPELTTSGNKAIYNQVIKLASSVVKLLEYFGAHTFMTKLQTIFVDLTLHKFVYWCTKLFHKSKFILHSATVT